jgi:hypothetical protein
MGKSTQKNVIASKNGDFARFCVAILSMIMEIASTPCGKTTAPGLTNVIASKNGVFARFCVAILSTVVEIASTQCGKTTAPGLAANVIASKNGVFARFCVAIVNGGGDCFDPVRKNHSHWISQCQKTYDAMACMLKSVLDAECPHMI